MIYEYTHLTFKTYILNYIDAYVFLHPITIKLTTYIGIFIGKQPHDLSVKLLQQCGLHVYSKLIGVINTFRVSMKAYIKAKVK